MLYLVGDADNQTVLGGVVLVFVLDAEALAGEVVSFALSSPLELGLVSLEVSLVLLHLDEGALHTALASHFRGLRVD